VADQEEIEALDPKVGKALVPKSRPSLIHGVLSAIFPGFGQLAAAKILRGVGIFSVFWVLAGLSVWTIAQEARFPDFGLSAIIFLQLFVQTTALLLFFRSLRYLALRHLFKETTGRNVISSLFDVAFVLAAFFVADLMLPVTGSTEQLTQVFGLTGVLAAAGLSLFYFWQISDAARIGAHWPVRSITPGILFACIVIFVLGWNITQIDLPKAVREYQDTQIILRRIVWPWRAAFEFETISVETSAKIQAPCPPGATGPPVNEPVRGEAWISATPTCGEISTRDLATGTLTLGTELDITGGGFTPGATVEIGWKNPIGNAFRPRGVGETDIEIDASGEFQTKLNIPEAVIPATAVGDQIHTLLVVEESGEVFTGQLSREMRLALVGILETIMLGLMATFFGTIFAVPISFLAARNLMTPISASMGGLVGGLVMLVPSLWLALQGASAFSSNFGGLEESPLLTAGILILTIAVFGYGGWRLGSWGIGGIIERAPGMVSRIAVALALGLLAAGVGYIAGLFAARWILSIPLGEAAASAYEPMLTIGGAFLFGGAGFYAAYRRGAVYEVPIGSIIYAVVRTILNVIRAIEPLIWALVGIIWIGPGPFAGMIALTLHTAAALGKLFSEAIESINPGPIEAIQATGGNRLQVIIYAVFPQVLPPFISFTIYRWDINVRLSTVIGLVGGGGIGFILIQWIRQFQYAPAGLAVWLIAITVSVLDFVSSEIRQRYV
jgi:ABC-type phosphate/phosphonate transport system permease subunit